VFASWSGAQVAPSLPSTHRIQEDRMGLGTTEILLICLLALILFGGGKLADIGKGLGEGIKNFKKGMKEANEDDDASDAKKAAPAKGAAKDEKESRA
jgi:sec-independent protein translocase protein TatA